MRARRDELSEEDRQNLLPGESPAAMALRLLYSNEYHSAKRVIMGSIRAFQQKTHERMIAEMDGNASGDRSSFLWLVGFSILGLCSMSGSSYLQRRLQALEHEARMEESELHREALRHAARHDMLTGLPNRTYFSEQFQHILDQFGAGSPHSSMLFIDLDHFKPVNDRFGHLIGDELLKEVGKRVRTCVRNTDLVARMGGDEFALLLPAITDPAIVERISECISASLREPFRFPEADVTISCSIGMTTFPKPGDDLDTVIHRSDEAMYECKSRSRPHRLPHDGGTAAEPVEAGDLASGMPSA
ncbi:MAG: GGDEF domain-containing protein [Geminicoccaceae bacterium]